MIARPHLTDLWIDLLTDLCDQNVDEWPLADDRSPARAACILCDDRPDTYAMHTPTARRTPGTGSKTCSPTCSNAIPSSRACSRCVSTAGRWPSSPPWTAR